VNVSRLVAWPIVVDLLSMMSQTAEVNRGRRQQEPDTFSVPLSNKKCSFLAPWSIRGQGNYPAAAWFPLAENRRENIVSGNG
jgi:hypothetical protein